MNAPSLPSAMWQHILPPRDRGRAAFYAVAVQHGCFAVAPAVCTVFLLVLASRHVMAFDFHYAYAPAGDALRHGAPLYAPTAQEFADHRVFLYPVAAAWLFAPLSLLPAGLGDALMTAVTLVAPLAALRIMEVRDWRLYGLLLLWPPVMAGWENANLTAILVLGGAGLWRVRDRPLAAGLLLAVLVSLKPLTWPLGLFFLATRRLPHLGLAIAAAGVLNLVLWGLVGFSELSPFLDVLREATRNEQFRGYGIAAFAVRRGLADGPAHMLGGAVALAAVAACLVRGRRGDERSAFALAVAAVLLASPVLWTHYLTFLLLPLAVLRPSLGPLWLLPLLTLPCPITPPSPWQHLLLLGVVAGVMLGLTASRPALGRRGRPSPSPSPSSG